MNNHSIDDRIERKFRELHEKARREAEKQGKTEVTQEEYEANSIVRLKGVYDKWRDRVWFEWSDDSRRRYEIAIQKTKDIPYTFYDLQKFYELNKSNDLLFCLFMCAVAKNLGSNYDMGALKETELQPFFESEKLLSQLLFLDEYTRNSRVEFQGLDTLVLKSCDWGSFSEFSQGRLVIDLERKSNTPFGSIGYKMHGGEIVVRNIGGISLGSLGQEMSSGTIVYEGDLSGSVGEEMQGGTIVVKGNLLGGEIGYKMKRGDIIIEGNYVIDDYTHYGVGHEMEGGNIRIGGIVKNDEAKYRWHIGNSMKGGRIYVGNSINGRISVGQGMSGNSIIKINSNCIVDEIGYEMEGGRIEINGNAGLSIGHFMEGGKIYIKGNVSQYENGVIHFVGGYMENGEIVIVGNVDHVGDEMRDGVIRVYGRLANKTDFIQHGGEIYENDVSIRPKIGLRLLGRVERWIDGILDK